MLCVKTYVKIHDLFGDSALSANYMYSFQRTLLNCLLPPHEKWLLWTKTASSWWKQFSEHCDALVSTEQTQAAGRKGRAGAHPNPWEQGTQSSLPQRMREARILGPPRNHRGATASQNRSAGSHFKLKCLQSCNIPWEWSKRPSYRFLNFSAKMNPCFLP